MVLLSEPDLMVKVPPFLEAFKPLKETFQNPLESALVVSVFPSKVTSVFAPGALQPQIAASESRCRTIPSEKKDGVFSSAKLQVTVRAERPVVHRNVFIIVEMTGIELELT